jgi:uncharacterized OsmC-like protein
MARAKRFEYAVDVDESGAGSSEAGTRVSPPEGWTPEHLVLLALGRCTLSSLRYHARRAGVEASGRASARGAVTRREEDGRFGLVEADVLLDVTLVPAPDGVGDLLMKAERDCFVGASLRVSPRYRWRVNGVETTPSAP